GTAGVQGTNDGVGGNARFFDPSGIALDSSGNVFVADGYIRRITPAGQVTTIPVAARYGIAGGLAGELFAVGSVSNTMRKFTLSGSNWIGSTIAGTGVSGTNDGTGSEAQFHFALSLNGLAIDGAGNLYAADQLNFTIRKLTPAGSNWQVSTIAGAP